MITKQAQTTQKRRLFRGQAVLEFTFAILVFVMLAYGMVAVVRWGFREIGHNRKAHDAYFEGGQVNSSSISSQNFSNAETSVGRIFQ